MILPGQSRLFLFYEKFCMTELELTRMVEKAKRWAVEAHAGQKDKVGEDYFIAHVSVVA
jgi:hypothetical protein